MKNYKMKTFIHSYTKNLLALSLAISSAHTFAAFNDSTTDYTTDGQNYHVWNESLKPVDLVNSILCFTGQMKYADFINAGPYLVLADEKACFKDDSGSSQSAGASNTPTYSKIIVNSTRASATDPLIVSVWMPQMGGGGGDSQAIKFKAVITAGASTVNPFGSFTFNYNMFDSFVTNNSQGGGEIKTVSIPGKIGFTLFESESNQNGNSSKNASVVMSTDRTSGIALTSNHESGNGQGNAYGLAFNSSNVLLQTADTYADLPFKSLDPTTGTESCLSRTQFDESVWRYDLYNATTGARIAVNSGVSFKYDSDADGTADSYGQVGYWGMWAEHPEAIHSGDTINAENPADNTTTPYTVVKAPGRLIKNTVEQLALTDAQGVDFDLWAPDAPSGGNWVVQYLTVAHDGVGSDGFYKVASSTNGNNGPQQTPLQTPVAVVIGTHEPLNMNSQQLGGPVKYRLGDNFLTFFKQEYVNGSETGAGQLLENGSVTLHCVFNCPKGTLGSTELSTFNGPYVGNPADLTSSQTYSFSATGVNALTLVRDSNSQPIKYADGLTADGLQQTNSPYAWGFRTGSMVTADVLANLVNPWDVLDPTKVTVFYEWETGLNSFNQTVSIKDAQGHIKTFDKPIQFTYTHSNANDRSGSAGAFDGKVVMINYGGNGQFWGIPSAQDQSGHQYAVFTIADGTTMGPNNMYVVKAREVEGTMKATNGQCSTLALVEPDAPVPTATTGSADIGDMPTVTAAPAVIAGVIQAPTTP